MVISTGLPYKVVNEHCQSSKTFAENFCNAIEGCFDNDISKVIAIGTDCATLHAIDILNANKHLNKHKNVIGADSHGGFYLLGLHKSNYDRASFLKLKWCTKALFTDVICYIKNASTANLYTLSTKNDINIDKDLKQIFLVDKKNMFVILLKNILVNGSLLINIFAEQLNIIFEYFQFSLRGPPARA